MRKKRTIGMRLSAVFLLAVLVISMPGMSALAEQAGGSLSPDSQETDFKWYGAEMNVELSTYYMPLIKGESDTLTVTVNGRTSYSYKYQWYVADSEYATGKLLNFSSGTYSIRITGNDVTDGDYYYCIVSDGGSSTVESSRCRVVVSEPEKLEVYLTPDLLTLDVGETGVIDAVVTGGYASKYTYEWYLASSVAEKGNKQLVTDPSVTYTPKSEGVRYVYCIVSDGTSTVTSNRCKIKVGSAEDLSSYIYPESMTLKVGEQGTIWSIPSGGDPAKYTYQWYQAESETGVGVKMEGCTKDSIDFSFTKPATKYIYCVVKDGTRTSESNRSKVVVEADELVAAISTTALNLKEGDRGSVSVKVSGGLSTSYTYKWYLANSMTAAGTLQTGASSSTFSFTAGKDYSGMYAYCVVSDGTGTKTSLRCKITVEMALKAAISSTSVSLKEKESRTVSVSASGGASSYYTYKWYLADSSSAAGTLQSNASSYYSITGSKSLNGKYLYCMVSDGKTSVSTARCRITIGAAAKKAQKVTVKTSKVSGGKVTYGTSGAKVTGKTNGNGKITYKSSNSKIVSVNANGALTIKGYGKATITATAAATSKYKKAAKKVSITVIPAKTTMNQPSASGSELHFSWTAGKSVTGYQFSYASGSNFSGDKKVTVKSANEVALQKSLFERGKTYRVRVRAYKVVGGKTYYGAWSNSFSFNVPK